MGIILSGHLLKPELLSHTNCQQFARLKYGSLLQPTSLSNYARTIFTPLKVDNFTLSEIHFDTTASSCSPESRHAFFSGCYCGHWSGHSGIHILRTYSLVHLVVAKLEELISRTLLGLFKIRLLFQDRVRSHNFRF